MKNRLVARYDVESPLPLAKVAEVIAGEQSSGTFMRLPGETDALRERSGARVEALIERSTSDSPSLPCRIAGSCYTRGEITLSWPIENMGASLTNALATVAGNLFELAQVSALRLLDVTFPQDFASACPGPAFGVAGTRELSGVEGRPMIGTIIKPSVGLTADETATLAGRLAEGGIDFIKDDELQANGPHNPLEERVQKVMRVLNDHADRTGRKVMYAFNITGEVDEMKRHADLVEAAGGSCIMVSIHSVGLAGLGAIRRHARLPLHCHRNGWGLFQRSPDIGISYRAWQKFWRLAGADHLHVNGIANKFSETDNSVIDSARAVGEPLFDGNTPTMAAMPVFSSGQTALQMPATFAAIRSPDFIFCAGGGVMGHPRGIAGGVASLREAAEAASKGIPLEVHAETHPELAAALEAFASRMS
ncbi:ribulose-bisphosphate carboxylase large subunit family protein [Oricola thermophila]|uniref:Ribulose-bisphosphate carboxylase large subunit family protein n=1 Tax=Oricola thermophila TaxID=2742145 RepID=A0A6N1VCD9_9HYPH|nr:ribulose-bisphosphate carboxylase large subunit family protein [Oricola thermophila]QKV18540.1 ribulose-bisphosphate carboxylase large subunit family protein [Oricola thermophila]